MIPDSVLPNAALDRFLHLRRMKNRKEYDMKTRSLIFIAIVEVSILIVCETQAVLFPLFDC